MTESTVGPWAQDKLDRLRKYLSAYTTIMKGQGRWCKGYHYVDAFAGPGIHTVRRAKTEPPNQTRMEFLDVTEDDAGREEQEQYLAGSPRVALELEHPFSTYTFVERSSDRVASLETLKAEFANKREIFIRREDCTHFLRTNVAENRRIDWSANRALVFLDPFGMQVGWSTIESLARTEAIEIFLNFPVGMAIQRLLLTRTWDFTDEQRRKLDEYFGSPDWFDVAYRRSGNLFGEEQIEKVRSSGEALLKWYRSRLETVFGFVSRAALIRNTRGSHLYYLLLAGHNATGVKIANNVLSAGDWI